MTAAPIVQDDAGVCWQQVTCPGTGGADAGVDGGTGGAAVVSSSAATGGGGAVASSSVASSSASTGSGGNDAGTCTGHLLAEEKFNYANGAHISNQLGGTGWDPLPRSTPETTCSTAVFPGQCTSGPAWLTSTVGLNFGLLTNTMVKPGYPFGTAMLDVKSTGGSPIDGRAWRGLTQTFGAGSELWIAVATQSVSVGSGGFMQVHLYNKTGKVNASYSCKEGEVYAIGKRAQSADFGIEVTTHGGAGGVHFDTTTPFADGNVHVQVLDLKIKNTAAACDGATCPACDGGLCNSTLGYYLDPVLGAMTPGVSPQFGGEKVVLGNDVEMLEIGAYNAEVYAGTIRVADAYCALW